MLLAVAAHLADALALMSGRADFLDAFLHIPTYSKHTTYSSALEVP